MEPGSSPSQCKCSNRQFQQRNPSPFQIDTKKVTAYIKMEIDHILVAGTAGGGMTVIANALGPADVALPGGTCWFFGPLPPCTLPCLVHCKATTSLRSAACRGDSDLRAERAWPRPEEYEAGGQAGKLGRLASSLLLRDLADHQACRRESRIAGIQRM